MSGDYTRFTFDPHKNYTGVLAQQGRVTVDADPNEAFEISDRRWRSETIDIIGHCVVPAATPNAFHVTPTAPGDFDIGLGRMYVDGLQTENHGLDPQVYDAHLGELSGQTEVPYSDQPYLPAGLPDTLPGTPGTTDLVYIDVWQREVTAIQDRDIREIALGGPDTATRVQTIWQVKALQNVGDIECPDDLDAWNDLVAASTGRLTTSIDVPPPSDDPCIISPSGGYRGVENRLYRVEIHTAGTASDPPGAAPPKFKWSRYNASIASTIEALSASRAELTVATLGRDQVLRFNVGDWIEVLDDRIEYDVDTAGHMAQVTALDEANRIITIDPPVPATTDLDPSDPTRHTRIVRWDQQLNVDTNGLLDVDATVGPIGIQDGIRVEFGEGTYKVADYWVFAARTADGSVETLETAPPRGIVHHYCRLALITWADPADQSEVDDCRTLWPPRGGCCVRVDPEDDLQQVVNQVIAAGGGCICLAPGVHVVTGPLRITGANGLTIHGTGAASVLRLEGVDAQGRGGIVVERSAHVTIAEMFAIGEGVPAVVSLRPVGLELNRKIALRDLTALNLSETASDSAGPPDTTGDLARCALWLAHAEDVEVSDCRLVAPSGIVALLGEQLPEPGDETDDGTRIGRGVRSLHVHRTTVRYEHAGILGLLANAWHVFECDVAPYDAEAMQAIRSADPGGRTTRRFHADLLTLVDDLIAAPLTARPGRSVAVTGFLWRDCKVACCHLVGSWGIRVAWWIRGTIDQSVVEANAAGVDAIWMHDTSCVGNTVRCQEGAGIQIAGAYRLAVRRNRIHARRSLSNLPVANAMVELDRLVDDITVLYSDVGESVGARWMLLEVSVEATGLTAVRDAAQAIIDTTDLAGTPVLLLVAGLAPPARDVVPIGARSRSFAAPIIDLRFEGNDAEGAEGCVLLGDFVPLGGMHIAHNRLDSPTGQAIRVNANPYFANVYLFIVLLRKLFDLVATFLPRLAASFRTVDDGDVDRASSEALARFFEILAQTMEAWRNPLERLLNIDDRIESNAVLSLLTGIESNLHELAVVENHITQQQRRITVDEFEAITGDLEEFEPLRLYGYGLREGNSSILHTAGDAFVREATAGTDPSATADASNKIFCLGIGSSDHRLAEVTADLSGGLNELDFERVKSLDRRFVDLLVEYTNNYGIWMKGPGCRIVENHLLSSPDADPSTWARGGVLVRANLDPRVDAFYLLILLLLSRAGRRPEALLGPTETLIDNNEIIGGAGHGVDVHHSHQLVFFNSQSSAPGGRSLIKTIFDVKVRGNQIRDMGGCGVHVDEEALAVAVDIEGNQILDCSAQAEVASLTSAKGGVVITNAALCRIIGNQITRTGAGQGTHGAFAVDLEAIFGLTIAGNRLLRNGSNTERDDNGGIALVDVFDQVGIKNNEITDNRGVGLAWANSAREGAWSGSDPILPLSLLVPVMLYWRAQGSDQISLTPTGSQALIEGNRIGVPLKVGLKAITLTNLNGLNLVGNVLDARGTDSEQGNICGIDEGVVASNHIVTSSGATPLKICALLRGVITGNVSTESIRLKLSPGVQHANNVPDVNS